MKKLFDRLSKLKDQWWRECEGIAAVEFAMVFPIMIMLLLGTVELGNGILANQKVIASSQMVTDLLTRTEIVTDEQLAEAKRAGRLALSPFDPDIIGFDIISIRYDPDSGDEDELPDPVIVWRNTDNMDAVSNIHDRVLPLALEGDGLLVAFVRFPYEPPFATRLVGNINMIEATFSRGRKSPVIDRE